MKVVMLVLVYKLRIVSGSFVVNVLVVIKSRNSVVMISGRWFGLDEVVGWL